MSNTTAMTRLGFVLALLAFGSGCSQLVTQNGIGVSALQAVNDTSQRPGSGITRYPVRMRDVSAD